MLALYYVFSFDLNEKSHRKSNYNPQIYSCAVIQCMIIWCYACCRSWVLVVPLRCAETWIRLGWELLLVVMSISGCGWCHYWRCEEQLSVLLCWIRSTGCKSGTQHKCSHIMLKNMSFCLSCFIICVLFVLLYVAVRCYVLLLAIFVTHVAVYVLYVTYITILKMNDVYSCLLSAIYTSICCTLYSYTLYNIFCWTLSKVCGSLLTRVCYCVLLFAACCIALEFHIWCTGYCFSYAVYHYSFIIMYVHAWSFIF